MNEGEVGGRFCGDRHIRRNVSPTRLGREFPPGEHFSGGFGRFGKRPETGLMDELLFCSAVPPHHQEVETFLSPLISVGYRPEADRPHRAEQES